MCTPVAVTASPNHHAGLALGKGPAHTTETGDIATMLDTNCKAVAILTRDVAAGMVKRNYVRLLYPAHVAMLIKELCGWVFSHMYLKS